MCHDPDAMPAIPRDESIDVEMKRITLHAADRSTFSAISARPVLPARVGVVIFPDNRGLSSFYGEVACRIAELGYCAVAIDYFGRTAGTGDRSQDFPFMEHLMKLTRPGLEADFAAAVRFLQSDGGCARSPIFALGFCFGGRQAYLAATLGHRLSGVMGFYGFPGTIMGAAGPTERAADISSPVLAIWAGADDITAEQIDTFTSALNAAHVEHESVVYPGAPHSFFDLRQAEYQEASRDAWRRVRAFIDRNGNGPNRPA